MPANLPFPIAYTYHLIDAARTPEARYGALLQCYEAVVHYCAAVQLSDYVAAGCPDAAVNGLLLSRLGRNLLLGHWIELTREITARQKSGLFRAFMPEMAAFYFRPGKSRSLTPEGEIFDSVLCAARNDSAHPDRVWSSADWERKYNEHREPHLDRLLRALQFLERYPLYVPYAWGGRDIVDQAIVLMGAGVPPSVRSGLGVTPSPALRAGLEDETTAFLAAPDDPGRQLLLYPMSVFHRRGDREDIYLFENCEISRKQVKSLLYRAFSPGQQPLEIVPGEDYARLVEQFRAMLQALGGAPASTERQADELSAHYFSAQREVIRDWTQTFVGREYVEAALDRFTVGRRRGYFIVRGGPGQGKTAVACQLIKTRSLVHHLIHATGGRADPRLILRSLLAQLIPLAGGAAVPAETLPELTKQFEDALGRAAGRLGKLVVVIDALDELAADAADPPFLATAGLPEGVFFVVTSRPDDRLRRLTDALPASDCEVYTLGALELRETAAILRARRPAMTDAEVERVAEACQGNPLYLLAVSRELDRDPRFDLRALPADIEGFFRRATAHLRRDEASLGRDVLGLLSVARKPLTPRELSQVTGRPMRLVHEQGLRPIRQFLFEAEEGSSFYHARFRDFVARELLYEDELSQYHSRLADWLLRPETSGHNYRWTSVAHHLFESGDHAALLRVVDGDFLRQKVRRFGYAVLEDVELLTRALMEANDPGLVRRCIALVEGLRAEAGGDIIEDIRQAVQAYRPGPTAFRSRVLTPPVPSVPGLDVWVGMLPKVEVGADFFEVIPVDARLVLVLGDAPGAGLTPAFIARFVGNACRRLAERERVRDMGELLGRVNALVSGHDCFCTMAVQCAEIDLKAGVLIVANAGVPPPVLYSRRWEACDELRVRGEFLHAAPDGAVHPSWQQRRAEIGAGDVLVGHLSCRWP